jgi:putative hydrolase of the HAD superfamily
MTRLEAVIFDLGNVLVFHDNEKLFAEMAKAFGCDREEFARRLEPDFWPKVNRGQLPGDQLRQALVERVGGNISADEFVEVWNCHFTLNEPMLPLIDALVGKVKLVLLSNTHDLHFGYLKPKLPVLERFEGCVLSYEVGHVKPEVEIFEHALKIAGCLPSACVFFDDVADYVEAAKKRGLNAHVYTDAAAYKKTMKRYRLK